MRTRYLIGGAVVLWMAAYAMSVKAEMVASMPNNANGKIVLTDEICKHNGKVYEKLNRAYNYGVTGYGSEGCWTTEDETVLVYWIDTDQKMRYPVSNFTINSNYSKKKGSNNGYKY